MASALETSLDERAQVLLKALIERYIRDGQPVGSRTLARDAGLDLSPATIRNVMADLEDFGLISSPHTSAGRIPTVSGYRLFVDSMLSLQPLEDGVVKNIRHELEDSGNSLVLVESASKLLSRLTAMTGVVTVPRRDQVVVKQIEFIALSDTRVLTVLVTSNGEVMNRIIETSRRFERAELERAGNYLTSHFAGLDLNDVRARLLRDMDETRKTLDRNMAEAMQMARAAMQSEEDGDFIVSGQTHLLDFDELAQIDRLRQLMDAFAEKQEILHLLDRSMQAQGVQIFIGEESGNNILEKCSVITSPYVEDDQVVGVLAVIGPTRMAYDRVIPIVDITSKLLSAALGKR